MRRYGAGSSTCFMWDDRSKTTSSDRGVRARYAAAASGGTSEDVNARRVADRSLADALELLDEALEAPEGFVGGSVRPTAAELIVEDDRHPIDVVAQVVHQGLEGLAVSAERQLHTLARQLVVGSMHGVPP